MIATLSFRRAGALALMFAIGLAPPALAGAELAPAAPEARGPVTNLPLPRFVSMRAETANARRGPSLDQRIDWEFVRRGMPLEVTAEYGNWRRVRDVDGQGGWVHHTLLSGARTALVQGDAPVPLRADPDGGSAVRAMAEPGVIGEVEACVEGWCEIEADGVAGWLPRNRLWGVAPGEVID
jgi:SH3-like domain-containing protein